MTIISELFPETLSLIPTIVFGDKTNPLEYFFVFEGSLFEHVVPLRLTILGDIVAIIDGLPKIGLAFEGGGDSQIDFTILSELVGSAHSGVAIS